MLLTFWVNGNISQCEDWSIYVDALLEGIAKKPFNFHFTPSCTMWWQWHSRLKVGNYAWPLGHLSNIFFIAHNYSSWSQYNVNKINYNIIIIFISWCDIWLWTTVTKCSIIKIKNVTPVVHDKRPRSSSQTARSHYAAHFNCYFSNNC